MIPTYQTKFGNGNGNCLLACVASILERPLDSIPDFTLSGCGWFGDLYEWCLNEGIGIICVDPNDLNHSLCFNLWCILCYTVANIETEYHAVIGKCKRVESVNIDAEDETAWHWEAPIVFDPNPMRVEIEKLKHIIFLIPNQEVRS